MSTVPFDFIEFATQIGDCSTPAQILNALDEALPEDLRLNVWGAMRFPLRWNNLDALVLNETVFLHESAPAGHWCNHRRNTGPVKRRHCAAAPE